MADDRGWVGGESDATRDGVGSSVFTKHGGAAFHHSSGSAPSLASWRGEIESRGVSVVYPAGTALRASISHPGGSSVAIVGANRLGEKHWWSLIPRMARSDRGLRPCRRIDLRQLSPQELRRRSCLCPRDILFSASHAENIALGVEAPPKPRSAAPQSSLDWLEISKAFRPAIRPWSASAGLPLSGGQSSARPIARAWYAIPRS